MFAKNQLKLNEKWKRMKYLLKMSFCVRQNKPELRVKICKMDLWFDRKQN